jgi:release factor glutamine methyltransferase
MQSEEPEAYRLGWVPFLGLKIWLDSHPLIPRPETEWWVEELILELKSVPSGDAYFSAEKSLGLRPSPSGTSLSDTSQLSVLDLCAGSGAIGCAILAQCPNAQVYFCEIDPEHEATIRKNIRENKLDESRAEVRIGDLFEPFAASPPAGGFDFIAANPPYVPEGRELPVSVADYEPALALRAGPDGLAVIRRIALELPRHLAKGGAAWVECDAEHADAARELFTEQGFKAFIKNDQYERPRVIVISF